jgi:hypothetical protein
MSDVPRQSEEPAFATTVQGVDFPYIPPLHVSALTGHLQAEHTILYEVTTRTADPLSCCNKSYCVRFWGRYCRRLLLVVIQ